VFAGIYLLFVACPAVFIGGGCNFVARGAIAVKSCLLLSHMPPIERIVNFINRHKVLSHVAFWLVVYLLLLGKDNPYGTAQMYSEDRMPMSRLIPTDLFYLLFSVAFAYFYSYRILPRLFKARNYGGIILELVAGSYLICAIARVLVVYVLEPLTRPRPFTQESLWEIFSDVQKLFFGYYLFSISLALIFIFMKLMKDQYEANRRTLTLEKQQSEMELSALKAQLNPHFLFNTLNNIYALSLLQSVQTSPAIARLSEILDHLLYRSSGRYVPVSQEIGLLENYIALEKLRYDERLKVSFDYQTERDVQIAPLILLSLVENAFKHGAGEDAGSPEIAISLSQKGNAFLFIVKNSFYMSKERANGQKIGLANIVKQLALVYPKQHTFTATTEQQTFIATLHIQLTDQ
jgi:sensor histidine kinase YesM